MKSRSTSRWPDGRDIFTSVPPPKPRGHSRIGKGPTGETWVSSVSLDACFLASAGSLGAFAARIVAAGLERAVAAAALDHGFATDRTGLVQRLRLGPRLTVAGLVGSVPALRVAAAGEERAVAAGPLHELALPALGAGLAGRRRIRLGLVLADVLALGVSGAAHELAVATLADLEGTPAIGARLVQKLRLHLLAGHQYGLA